MKKLIILFLLFPSLLSAQGGPVGGSPSGPVYVPSAPTATEADDGKALVWDFAENVEVWSDLSPDHLVGDTTDDGLVDDALIPTSITRDADLSAIATSGDITDATGTLPVANGGTGATDAAGARTNLDVDVAGTDNSTDVTLSGTPDYITISGQDITRGQVDLAADVTGDLDPDMISGDTVDDDAIDIATLSADAQASLGLADSAVQDGDTVSFDGITDTSDGATNIAVGTLGTRPAGTVGDIRYNSTSGEFEAFGAAWDALVQAADLAAVATSGLWADTTDYPSGTFDGDVMTWAIASGWVAQTLAEAGIQPTLPTASGDGQFLISDGTDWVDAGSGLTLASSVFSILSGLDVDGSGTYPTTTLYGGAASGSVATALKVENTTTGADGGGVRIVAKGKRATDTDYEFGDVYWKYIDESMPTVEAGISGADQYALDGQTRVLYDDDETLPTYFGTPEAYDHSSFDGLVIKNTNTTGDFASLFMRTDSGGSGYAAGRIVLQKTAGSASDWVFFSRDGTMDEQFRITADGYLEYPRAPTSDQNDGKTIWVDTTDGNTLKMSTTP